MYSAIVLVVLLRQQLLHVRVDHELKSSNAGLDNFAHALRECLSFWGIELNCVRA